MNKVLKNVVVIFVLILGVGLLVACNGKEDPKLTLEVESAIEIAFDETKNIGAKTDSEEEIVIKFSSTNPSIVSIDDKGNIKGVDLGEATIRVTLPDYPEVKKEVKVTVKPNELTISGDAEVFAGSTITLTATDEKGGNAIIWDTDNSSIASVDQTGVVTGLKVGKANIIAVSSITGEMIMKEITVLQPDVESITINKKGTGKVFLLDQVELEAKVLPVQAKQEVTWTSGDEAIATVDANGKVTTYRSGEVEITAKSVADKSIVGIYTLEVELDPIKLVRSFNVENPIHQYASSRLIPTLNDLVYGSVNLYWTGDMNLQVNIVPIDQQLTNADGSKVDNPYVGQTATQEIITATELKSIRPGVKKPSIDNIIFHDTGNNNAGAGALMHHNWMIGGGRDIAYKSRSWHYTVDDSIVMQHLPDDEIAFHGDRYEAYTTTIGIETAISKGSNFFTTWHRTAKLMSSLMYKYGLSIDSIKQHFDYSGKDCPQVLRATGLWNTALEMIQAEYLVLQELDGYKVEFISNAPDYVTNEGRIIKLDSSPKYISYQVKITNATTGYNETTVLYSTLPAKLA